jgi:hypothetical protein
MFKPATRAFGNIAILGNVDNDARGPVAPIPVTNPNNVSYNSRTTLSNDIDAATTTITVESSDGFPTSGDFTVRIDDETMNVTAVSGTNLTVTRGHNGTTADSHNQGAAVIYETKDKPIDNEAWFKGDLGKSVRKGFAQTPGPSLVYAIRADLSDEDERKIAFGKAAKLPVQIMALANTPLESATQGKDEIEALASHVNEVSGIGDGNERIGVAMLGKGVDGSVVTTEMPSDRMIMVAHKSDDDAAAAVAGTIAGYEPHISLLLKQVMISMDDLFSDSEIDAFNTARINWLTDPSLLPGKGVFMGEGYTLGTEMPYIDIVRTIDDISFKLKAELIRSIGKLRVSRSGLRALSSQMIAILQPLQQRGVLEGYDVFFPLLVLLDKEPADLTDAELQQIANAQNSRVVDAIVSVDYAGAIHRLNITLKFE